MTRNSDSNDAKHHALAGVGHDMTQVPTR